MSTLLCQNFVKYALGSPLSDLVILLLLYSLLLKVKQKIHVNLSNVFMLDHTDTRSDCIYSTGLQ